MKLIFSQAITLTSAQPLKVTLGEDTQVLDEVVVTALGIKRATKALSYNVQEVKGDELTTVKSANFMNSLAGKVAGVNINASSSGVGGATRVVMRGTKSISSDNNALYVIDGVPIFNTNKGDTNGQYSAQPRGEGISDINPEDIESMSVLSGPAAAALYGSNAASGVILITTKKGKEGKARIIISNNSTFSNPFIMPEFQNSYINRAGSFASWGDKASSLFGTYEPKDFFNTGTNIQNNVSLSVGNEKNQTYLSVGTTNATGIIQNSKYDRYNFTFRNTTKFLKDKMTLDVGFSYIIQEDLNLMAQGEYFNPLPAVYLFPRGENFEAVRMYKTYDTTRKIDVQNWGWGDPGYSMKNNPYWVANEMNHGMKKQRYMANASLKYEILDWLDVTGRVRIDNATNDYSDKRNASTDLYFTNSSIYGFYKYYKADDRQAYADVMANINKRFGDLSLSANIGGSFTQTYYDERGFQGGLKDMSNVFSLYNMTTTLDKDTYPIESGYKQRTNSIFASAEIGWKSMLYMTLTGRNDWDSALINTEQSSFFYPSIGLSGVISEMVKLPKAITYLKVRGSFASVGAPIPKNLSSNKTYEWDPATSQWKLQTYRPLPKLYPERTNSWEAGLNAKFFNNSLSLEVTWYKANTRKQTFQVPLSGTAVYATMYAQSGNIENKGIELTINATPVQLRDFSWQTTLTYTKNKNKVLKLSEGKSFVEDGKYLIEEGSPLGQWFGQKALGIYATDEANAYIKNSDGSFGDRLIPVYQRDPNNYNNYIYGSNGKPIFSHYETKGGQKYAGDVGQMTTAGSVSKGGDIIWDDLDHDGVIGDSDRRILGNGMPTWYMGWTNYLNYKNFSLSFSFYGSFGNKIYNKQRRDLLQNSSSNMTPLARDCYRLWKYQGQITEVYSSAKATTGVNNARELSSFFLEDGDYIRLTNTRLAYRVDRNLIKRFHISDLQLYVYGNNLLTWTKYKGFDPSSISNSNVLRPGIDNGRYPTAREIGFGLNVNF